MAEETARFHQAREQFESLLDLPEADRPPRLAELAARDPELAAEVERLLAWDRQAGEIFHLDPTPPELALYRLGELLGRGGMGAVYRAERTDGLYKKTVAVKVLESGPESAPLAGRFRAERQILAALEHPHIARLLDGGTTADGRPYFVMELVEGEPIDRYCDARRLPLPRRLEIFLKVCAAVSYAHRHLVVHRDLKPGNILVSQDGEPRLLDFGIAKLLERDALDLTVEATAHGPAPLTPEYASPEQVCGRPVSASSDVYSLGVLLFRLATGRRPYSLTGLRLDQMVAAIAEREPPKASVAARLEDGEGPPAAERAAARGTDPRALARRLAGDLDVVIATALRKDPERRYPSVEQLAHDVAAHLEGRPIRARRDTFGYRAGKLLQRHRWAASAAAVSLAALLALVVMLWRQRLDLLERQRQLIAERNLSRSVSGFLTEVFAMPDPARSRGREVTASELLDRGVAEIGSRLAAEPQARSELLLTMGRSYKSLGRYEQAAALFTEALALRRELSGTPPAALADALHELAEVASLSGRYAEAERLEREALAARRSSGAPPDPSLVEGISRLATALHRGGRLEEAAATFEEAVALARRLDARPALAAALQRFASLERRRDRRGAAEELLREALGLQRALWGEDHPAVALTRNDLGLVLLERGRPVEAEGLFREAEQRQRRLYPAGHPDLATTLHNRALVAREEGRAADAEALLREAIALYRRAYGGDDPQVATSLGALAGLAQRGGRAEEAEALLREALAIDRRLLPTPHPQTAEAANNLALLLLERGRSAEAEPLFVEALEQTRATLGERHSQAAVILNNLGFLAQSRKDYPAARERYAAALEVVRAQPEPRAQDLALALHNLGALASEEGDLAAAEERFGEALGVLTEALGDDHLNAAMVRLSLAEVALRRDRPAQAGELAGRALDRLSKELAADDPWVLAARRILEQSLERRGGLR